MKTVRIHKGVDWAAPVGTPIFAAFDGEIVFQGDGGDYGNLVRIAHGNGRETRYAHMQRFALATGVGTAVKAGDVIGYIGTTGLSTGPHLHFEVHQGGAGRSIRSAPSRVGRIGRFRRRNADRPDHPRRKRRQRPRQESAVFGDRRSASSSPGPGSG